MIDQHDFASIAKELSDYDAKREKIIKEARDITKLSKHAIYCLHRNEVEEAKQALVSAENELQRLIDLTNGDSSLRQGSLSQSVEEYVEAKAFLYFLERQTLMPRNVVASVDAEEYLLGLCDLTGELGRYAVLKATARDTAAVKVVRDLLDALFGKMLELDLRNGELRRKYDGVKYAVQKVEQLLYELELRS